MATHPARRGWSYAEFARLPDDGNRYEVIDGELFVTPAPQPLHTLVGFKLATVLDAFVIRHDLGWVMPAPVDVLFGDDDYVQPDVVFVRREHGDAITDRGIEVPPDLVVEVLSPSTRDNDLGAKRLQYLAAGVSELWLVDPAARAVTIAEASGERRLAGHDLITARLLRDFAANVADLFAWRGPSRPLDSR